MADQEISRKLAVIVHADVVGSTALVQRNEMLAHERMQDAFNRFSKTIEAYGGTPHELRGDALVAEFDRASDAVSAALAFQARNAQFNTTLYDDIQPQLRIGISLGEVVIADNTVTGEGVVLAQRLEQLASPGSVCIQGAVSEAVPGRLPFEYESLGEQQLKGFDEPVRAYAVTPKRGETVPAPEQTADTIAVPTQRLKRQWLVGGFIALFIIIVGGVLAWLKPWAPGIEPASVERMAFPLPDKPSIAVLPFANMSDDPKQEYFVDGMTEDLITDLSKLSGLFVIARNSVFTYKGKPVKVRQVAEELGVRYVLEGSVRRADSEVRINAQLIDATTGGHLWAERYDGSLADVFTMQDTVTQKIVMALAVNLTGEEQTSQARSKTNDPQAYDAFLQGWEHYRRSSPEDLKKSITHLDQATKRDPNYSQAYAALAAVYWRIYSNLWYGKVLGLSYGAPAFEKALEYLEEAKKAPSSLAHQVAAEMAAHLQRNPDKALTEAERALALDSNDPAGQLAMAIALLKARRPVEAEPRVREAMRLDPLYPAAYLVLLGQIEFAMARYRAAAATLERAADIDPSNDKTFVYLTATYGHLGRQADAKAALERANQLRANAGWGAFTLFSVHKLSFLWVGDVKPFKEGLRKVGVPHGSGWFQLVKTVEGGFEVEGATKINVEEAKALYDQDAVFIDVSRVWRERIPGAHFLVNWHDGSPSEFNEVRLAKIADRKQRVVIYHGKGLDRDAAIGCAKALTWGFKNVYYLSGGLRKWKAAGYAVE